MFKHTDLWETSYVQTIVLIPSVSLSVIGHLDSPHSQNHMKLTSNSTPYPKKNQTFQMALIDLQKQVSDFLSSYLYKFCETDAHILVPVGYFTGSPPV